MEPNRVIRRRRRKFLACDACSQRKIQCDRARPRCNWCHHHDIPCLFTRGISPSETVKAKTSGEDTFAGSPPLAGIFQPENPEPNLLLATIYLCNGVPFFSARGRQWIEAQTGERVALAHYTPPRRIGLLNSGFLQRQAVFLPDQETVRSHFALYKASVFFEIFPFLEASLFEETIETAYSAKNDTDSATSTARACIFAFMSIVCVFSKDLSEEQLDTGNDYSSQAYRLLPGIFGDSMTVDGLQAILMLCFYSQTVAGDLLGVELLLSAATRFVFHLRANISAPRPSDTKRSTLTGHARKFSWLCYLFCQEITMRTGLAPCLDDVNCDLTLPAVSECSPLFLVFIRLGLIQSQIYRRLHAPSAMGQTDAELLCTIRELDELLEGWRLSIPSSARPTFTCHPTEAEHTEFSILQLEYHYCMAIIHQASGRCQSWTENQDTAGPASSLAISVEVSRSLLRKFSNLELRFHQYNLIFFLPYLAAAMIHLFCHLLVDPVNAATSADIDLIAVVPGHLATRVWPQAPTAFKTQVEYVRRLGVEIQRLSRSVVFNTVRVQGYLARKKQIDH